MDCGVIVSASNRLRVTSECLNLACNGSVYEWNLQKWKDTVNVWENIPILSNMTPTLVNATSIVIKKNSLPSNTTFRLKLFVTSLSGLEGFGELEFKTSGAPHSGYCASSVSEGVALETEFTFECFEWKDESTPLSYEFRVEDDLICYGGSSKFDSTVLPAGQPEDEYKLRINIVIKNSVGVPVEETLFVKVTK